MMCKCAVLLKTKFVISDIIIIIIIKGIYIAQVRKGHKCATCLIVCLQCFDAVGWAAGRASGL